MDFTFNETQLEVQQLANQILQDLSTNEQLNKIDQQDIRFDKQLWQQLAESGLLGICVDEAYGGMGFGFTELCLFLEEVGRTVAAIPAIPSLVNGALLLQQFGSQAQQQQYLPKVVSGDFILTAGLHEYQAEDPAAPQTTAIKQGDNFALNGCKVAVPFAKQAQKLVMTAQYEGNVAVLLVAPNAQGVTLHEQISTTKEPWYEVQLDNALVNASDVVSLDNGEAIANWISQRSSAATCAMQIGVCEAMLNITAQYTCERVQFDVPIGSFQAVQHRMADGFIDLQCLRLTTYQAVSLLENQTLASNEVMIAKIWAGDTGHRMSYAAQHLHGGTGIDKDYHLWRYCLWARQNEVVLGTSAALLAKLGEQIAKGNAFAE